MSTEGLTSPGVAVLEVVVVGIETDLQDISGSVAILDEDNLDTFDYVDLGKLLMQLQVYVGRGRLWSALLVSGGGS